MDLCGYTDLAFLILSLINWKSITWLGLCVITRGMISDICVNVGRNVLYCCINSIIDEQQDVRNDLSSFSLCCLLSVLDTILQTLCARLKGTLTLVSWRWQLQKS